MGKRIEVGVLGATGMVGQQFVAPARRAPVVRARSGSRASERSEGKRYADAAPWRLTAPMPDGRRRPDRSRPRRRAAARSSCSRPSTPASPASIERAFADGRPRRGQQRPEPPHGPGRAAARSPRSTPTTWRCCRRSAARAAAGRARSSPTRTARPSCSTMALAPLRRVRPARVIVTTHAGGVRRRLSRACRRSTSSAT